MKHTDKFFLFPIKVYNDEITEETTEENAEWVAGYARLPLEELYTMTWFDTYTSDRPVKEVSEKGCDLTRLVSERYGAYICLWPRKKFENKLNEYMDGIESELTKIIE